MKLEDKKYALKKIFSEILKINVSQINEKISMKDLKEWDSMAHVRLIIETEKKFKIKINFQEAEKITSFKSFFKLLDSKSSVIR